MILRLRSLLEMVEREHGNWRARVVAHQVIANCMRYLLEDLDEARILQIDRLGEVPNCGITADQRHTDADGRPAPGPDPPDGATGPGGHARHHRRGHTGCAQPMSAPALQTLAGERLSQRIGPVGALARELAAEIPGLLRELGGG